MNTPPTKIGIYLDNGRAIKLLRGDLLSSLMDAAEFKSVHHIFVNLSDTPFVNVVHLPSLEELEDVYGLNHRLIEYGHIVGSAGLMMWAQGFTNA